MGCYSMLLHHISIFLVFFIFLILLFIINGNNLIILKILLGCLGTTNPQPSSYHRDFSQKGQ